MAHSDDFIELARRFDAAGELSGRGGRINWIALINGLGAAIIEAVNAGLIADDYIVRLVAWAENRGDHPGITAVDAETLQPCKSKPGKSLVRCAGNVTIQAVEHLQPRDHDRFMAVVEAPEDDLSSVSRMLAQDERERTAATCRTLARMVKGEASSTPQPVKQYRSPARSKAELARRILNRDKAKSRDVEWTRFDLKQEPNRPKLWTIALDSLSADQRERVEAAN